MGQHMLDWGLWRYLIAISMSEGQITEAGGTLYCVIGLISPRIDEESDTRLTHLDFSKLKHNSVFFSLKYICKKVGSILDNEEV